MKKVKQEQAVEFFRGGQQMKKRMEKQMGKNLNSAKLGAVEFFRGGQQMKKQMEKQMEKRSSIL
jgi:hypothetical protein